MRVKCEQNLVNQIYFSLKQDILWMRLKPGEMLTEQATADIYHTSKTSVRGALALLAHDDLVRVFPHKGYMVTEISLSDAHNLFEYRWVLENANIAFAVKCATKEQLKHLDSLAEHLDAYTEESPCYSTFTRSNSDFHLYLAQINGNPVLLSQLIGVIEKLQRFMWVSTTKELVDLSIEEHHELVKYIGDKKTQKAQSLMQKHINDVFESGLSKMSPRNLSRI